VCGSSALYRLEKRKKLDIDITGDTIICKNGYAVLTGTSSQSLVLHK
jgi:hypothetical protein